jgi:hypothetical protein
LPLALILKLGLSLAGTAGGEDERGLPTGIPGVETTPLDAIAWRRPRPGIATDALPVLALFVPACTPPTFLRLQMLAVAAVPDRNPLRNLALLCAREILPLIKTGQEVTAKYGHE